jgi:hypothetical protein
MPRPRPLCFVIMPYGRKATQVDAGHGPGEIDFNALWDRAYVPVIEQLGFDAVRADQDTGAMIITQMLERIYFADLVLADMTIANGNVYYEVGIRHASKEKGCVLLAADWSRPLFDVAQLRTVRYPLAEGDIQESTAKAIRDAIAGPIAALMEGISPMHSPIKGFPLAVDMGDASAMKQRMSELSDFQAEVRAVRLFPANERMQRAQALVAIHGVPPMMATVALHLLRLLRDSVNDNADWKTLLAFIDSLPADFRTQEMVREERAFVVSQIGGHVEAIAQLNALIEISGPTVERLGLLGGRYKRLYRDAPEGSVDRPRYLESAIEHYERGMDLDLNEYYCSSNLPRLYRSRGRKGDLDRARSTLKVVIAACERAKRRGVSDEWLRPTLLAAAFDDGDADLAEELAVQVVQEGVTRWKIDSVFDDLVLSAKLSTNERQRNRLTALTRMLAQQSGIDVEEVNQPGPP